MFLTKSSLWQKAIIGVFCMVIFTFSADAATHLVTNTNDSGAGSLRQAFLATAIPPNNSEINYIEFDAAVFSTPQTITLSSFIQVSHSVGIIVNGPGKNLLTITGGSSNTTFEIMNGNFTLNNLAFRNLAQITGGGNLTLNEVLFDGVSNPNNSVIFMNNAASININRTEIINSPMTTGYVLTLTNMQGPVNINDSTIANNLSGGIASGSGASNRTINIFNSTICNNGRGAINILGTNLVTYNIVNTTIARNSSVLTGAGIRHDTVFFSSIINLRNSIIADNIRTTDGSFSDITGPVVSQGNNLIRSTIGATISGNTASNITGVSPMLAATLDFNGGTTRNYALLMGSPAIDAGNNCVVADTCFAEFSQDFLAPLLTDQRGVNRQIGANVDIGAFEFIAPLVAQVSIGGRITNESGNGIARVRVSLTKPNGEIVSAMTGAFGFYHFENIQVGENYVLQAQSKRFQFQNNPRIISVSEELQNEDFTAIGNLNKQE